MRDLKQKGYFERIKRKGTIVLKRENKSAVSPFTGKTLLINGLDYDYFKMVVPHSWFVFDQMQKGIINTWPGTVRMLSAPEILDAVAQDKSVSVILIETKKETVAELERQNAQFVIIDNTRELGMIKNSVTWEMLIGVYELMSYLIRLGHRRIGFIGGPPDVFSADRYAMYELGLKARGIPFDGRLALRGVRGYEEDGQNAMRRLLALSEPPTAVFVDTDVKALGAVKAAKEAGLRVPEDISIAGFDDIPGLANHSPPLTTVRIPNYDIGVAAAEMVMRRSDGLDCGTEVVKSSLIVRESCAPPALAACRIKEEAQV
jgi:LacI family transcriptional regulator